MNFPSIRLEGSIFTADLLDAIAREDKHSQKPADFGLDSSMKVKDEIASTWASAKALWTGYQAKIASLREGQTGVSETRNLFILPLLALLGYQPEKADAEILNGKSYAISHRDISRDGFPLHIMGWHDSLEQKRASGGPRISPHALLQEYVNLTEHLYGLITNGRQLRLLRDSSRLIKLSFLEFDLLRIFEEDLYADFAVLFRLLHATRMPANRANASGSVLEKYHQESVDSGSRIRDGLAAAVAFAMQTVANGLLAHPANDALVEQLRADPGQAPVLHQNLLRWVYRTLFVLVIEERVLHHAPEATLRQRQLYRDYYSLQRLRRLADRPQLADRRAHDLWRAMHQTLRLYEDGGKGLPLGIPPLGSFLFREEGLQAIFQYQLDNRSLLEALHRLSTFTHPDTHLRLRVNYGALDVEEFGSVYESLLELRPRIIPEGEQLSFSYAQLAGNERKTTGSYYTPDSLVQCLLDSALDPVVAERLKGKTGEEAEKALLSIKVCDPAVGSGHFLIGAAHRLAQRLADIRAGEEALSPDVQRHALRDVVNRCLYGVDINPLSVELCKVSLWMLALDPGKPLGFLDHHIQRGNSLLGATPRLLDEGLPDAAFKPIAGDDNAVCTEAKRRNKDERKQLALFHGTQIAPWQRLGNLPAAMLELDSLPDNTTAGLHAKEERYADLIRSSSYLHSRFLADTWCAAFVWKKCKLADGGFDYPITNDVLRKIERNPHDCAHWMREEIERLRDRYQFFHWHLAFPEVFPVSANGEQPTNEHAGWNRGFDVILGNPPWEKVNLKEQEWFAERKPEIAKAPTAAVRKKLIAQLKEELPALGVEFAEAVRQSNGESHMLRNSGLFPLCGVGDINLYAVFAERMRNLLSSVGRQGCIVQSDIATSDTYQFFFSDLIKSRTLVSFFDFVNTEGLFPAIHRTHPHFCLLTIAGCPQSVSPKFAFWNTNSNHLAEKERIFELSAEDIALLNPNTRTCPIFRSQREAELTKVIHRRVPIFIEHGATPTNPWDVEIGRMFHAADDSALFRASADALDGTLKLYEAKCFFQYDHRFAHFTAEDYSDVPEALKGDPAFAIETRYRILLSTVPAKFTPRLNSWLLGYRLITNTTNERTVIVSVLPECGVVHSANLFYKVPAADAALLASNFNSFVADFLCRQAMGGTNLSLYVLEQLAIFPPATYAGSCAWAGQPAVILRDWLLPRVLELTYTAWDLEPFARDCGWFGPPFVWDEARRFQLRCELDAAFSHLYGLSRDDAAYILDTFPIVRRKDEAARGTYRTRDTILALYDQFADCAAAQRAFACPLNPPPATLAAAHRWTWRDLPMQPPVTHREPLPLAYQYVVTVMTELVLQAGGSVPWATLRMATDLLADRTKLAHLAEPQFGQGVRDWLALKGDRFDATHRFDQLSGMCFAGRLRVVSQDAELVVELLNLDQHADFAHVRFDARLALAVAHEMAAAAPDAAAVQEEKQVASLVPV